jgi:hypothetical protein
MWTIYSNPDPHGSLYPVASYDTQGGLMNVVYWDFDISHEGFFDKIFFWGTNIFYLMILVFDLFNENFNYAYNYILNRKY